MKCDAGGGAELSTTAIVAASKRRPSGRRDDLIVPIAWSSGIGTISPTSHARGSARLFSNTVTSVSPATS